MREIKFRCLLEIGLKMEWRYFDIGGKPHLLGNYRWVSPDLQFTGLKDKNGKEIYEGDLLDGHYPVKFGSYYHEGCWHIGFYGNDNGEKFPLSEWNESGFNMLEVIGNVYENPELLEVKQ